MFIEKTHPSALKEKQNEQVLQNSTKKRKSTTDASKQPIVIKPDKKPRLPESLTDANANGVVGHTQGRVDNLIVDFIIEDMHSLAVVEQPSFMRLVHGLQPMKKVFGMN